MQPHWKLSTKSDGRYIFHLCEKEPVMTLRNFPPFLGLNVISDGPTNGL